MLTESPVAYVIDNQGNFFKRAVMSTSSNYFADIWYCDNLNASNNYLINFAYLNQQSTYSFIRVAQITNSNPNGSLNSVGIDSETNNNSSSLNFSVPLSCSQNNELQIFFAVLFGIEPTANVTWSGDVPSTNFSNFGSGTNSFYTTISSFVGTSNNPTNLTATSTGNIISGGIVVAVSIFGNLQVNNNANNASLSVLYVGIHSHAR